MMFKRNRKSRVIADRFWEKVARIEDGCWLWTAGVDINGYGRFSRADLGRPVLAHRQAYELENGPFPEDLKVLHRCDNPPCVRPSHLFLGTQLDNLEDMQRKGRRRSGLPPKGAANWKAKLTVDDVREIRKLSSDGVYQRTIAELFHVAQSQIWSVVSRRTWGHVE